jgi:hypothetical protein
MMSDYKLVATTGKATFTIGTIAKQVLVAKVSQALREMK